MVRTFSLMLALLVLAQSAAAARAFAGSSDYTIVENRRVPIPAAYSYAGSMYYVEPLPAAAGAGAEVGTEIGAGEKAESAYFKEPQDLFIDRAGHLFVADTGNDRIVKLSPDGHTLGVYRGDPEYPLRSPEGIFVDGAGDLYIADTGNARIVHLSPEGRFVEQFVRPDSELLRDSLTFNPSKIWVSLTGYVYVVRGENILTLDANNRFRGFLGQTEIGFSIRDALLRLFATDDQRRQLMKRTATSYTNITADDKGVLYATSLDPAGEIKKLNSVGIDLYKERLGELVFGERLDSAEALLERMALTGETPDMTANLTAEPQFVDLAVDGRGIITALEQKSGKLYQYDPDANLLAVFGGKGRQQSSFALPVAVGRDAGGRLYVLDKSQAGIHVFAPSRFIDLVHRAVERYNQGEYEDAYELWRQVLAINENYRLAHLGLANALFKQEAWKQAMDEYRLADDREGYSKAFAEYRYALFRQYFALIVPAVAAACFLFVRLVQGLKRLSEHAARRVGGRPGRMGVGTGLGLSLGVVFHPLLTFERIANARSELNYAVGWILLLGVLGVRIVELFYVHYPLQTIDVLDSNLGLEAVKLLLPPLTWVAAGYLISAIRDGESSLGQLFMAACSCMVPYVLATASLTLLANVLTLQEQGLYSFIYYGIWVWVVLLFFVGLKTLNDYTLLRALGVFGMSVVMMALLWFVALLGYVLAGRLFQFVGGIVREIRMSWL